MDNFYVSPTEFASISGVSRQTLIFYEKKGIFLPAYKNEKGYRFYLMSQLDIIATIQSLQKIGLSLEEIKDYIEHRNAQSTYELFSNKMNTLKEIITTYHKMINMMETKCQLITKANQILTDMVYIEYRDEIKIIKSDYIPFNSKEINQYKILGESFNRFLIISLDVLICRYSPLFRAFPALFISEEPHKSFYYPSCFRSQK